MKTDITLVGLLQRFADKTKEHEFGSKFVIGEHVLTEKHKIGTISREIMELTLSTDKSGLHDFNIVYKYSIDDGGIYHAAELEAVTDKRIVAGKFRILTKTKDGKYHKLILETKDDREMELYVEPDRLMGELERYFGNEVFMVYVVKREENINYLLSMDIL